MRLAIGTWSMRGLLALGLAIFGTLAALHWRIGNVAEEVSIISTRQMAVLKELDHLGERVDRTEDMINNRHRQ